MDHNDESNRPHVCTGIYSCSAPGCPWRGNAATKPTAPGAVAKVVKTASQPLESLEELRADLKGLFLRSLVFHDVEWQRDAFALLLELRFRRWKIEPGVAIVGGDEGELAKVKAARERARKLIERIEAEGALLHDVVFR